MNSTPATHPLLEEIVRAREELAAANKEFEETFAQLRATINQAMHKTDRAIEAYVSEFEKLPNLQK